MRNFFKMHLLARTLPFIGDLEAAIQTAFIPKNFDEVKLVKWDKDLLYEKGYEQKPFIKDGYRLLDYRKFFAVDESNAVWIMQHTTESINEYGISEVNDCPTLGEELLTIGVEISYIVNVMRYDCIKNGRYFTSNTMIIYKVKDIDQAFCEALDEAYDEIKADLIHDRLK